MKTSARLILTAISALSFTLLSAQQSLRPYTEPTDTATVPVEGWKSISGPTRFTWVPADFHYRQFAAPPAINTTDTLVNAWRGERLGLQALVISPEATGELTLKMTPLRSADGKTLVDAAGSSVSFMRYVTTTAWNACGYPPDTLPTYTVADMIDLPGASVAMPARSVRPVWCTVEIPATTVPGRYIATVTLADSKTNRTVASLDFTVNVSARTLPAGPDQAFYLDLWQQPYSVSRYYGVEPWSPEHLKLMKPYMEKLARAGQKTVTAILFYEPWGEQSHDKFEPMVETVRLRDGSWKFDFTILDRYVDYMASFGIDSTISCFTMVPWELKFRYFDEATGSYQFLECKTDSPEYAELWTACLRSLADHQRQRGLYDKTMIVMDERGLPDMLNAYRVAHNALPDIQMSLAGSYHQELVDSLQSYTLIKGDFFPDDVMKRRREKGYLTLMYTCCATPQPSQFSNSMPADGAYLPVYATATGHDGYLHWSYMNWPDNPLEDSRFRMFAPGDTYFIYPDGRSSIRYERMVEGIQLSEKIRLLRDELTAASDFEGLRLLDEALLPIRTGALNPWYPTSTVVRHLHQAIDAISAR